MSMTCMECFKDFQKYEIMLTRAQTEVLARRRELFQLLDGDLFYKMRDWQKDFVKIFWSKPICDEDTFKLTLFLYNSCCPPYAIVEWIVTSTFCARDKTRKRLDGSLIIYGPV